jgi:SpoVK/Ycf46/Vps4 family AAA+-type ATPase
MKQPAVIFIDEIDSLLCSRSENENEASRRIKTEFLVQLDGARSSAEDKILMIGATNRPEELDEAARRRFVRRLYVPLPDSKARHDLIVGSIRKDEAFGGTRYELTPEQVAVIVERSKGYSAADMHNLIVEAAMAPLRSVDIMMATAENLRAVSYDDFLSALKTVKSSVSGEEVERYRNWNKKFGSTEFEQEE